MPSPADISVVIVTHESASDLPGCLAALAQLEGVSPEIIVADCASSDGSADVARSAAPRHLPVRVLALERNLGFSGGMNAGLAVCSAPFVLSLNADVRPEPPFAARLVERLASPGQERAGAVTGRLLRFPSPDEVDRLDACGMRLTISWRHLDRASGEVERGQWSAPQQVFGGTGAATLFRRTALDDVAVDGDTFLPEFHSFREDAELAFRLHERGWRVLYEPAARARHRRRVVPDRRRRLSAEINLHSLKNRYLLRAYHQQASNLLLTCLPALSRDLLILAYALTFERTSLPAYVWLWRERARILARRRRIQDRRTAPGWAVNRWFLLSGIEL